MGKFFIRNALRSFKPGQTRRRAGRPNPEGPPDSRPYFWPEEANYPGYTGPADRRQSLETTKTRQLPYYVLLLAVFCLFILLTALLRRESGSRFTPNWKEINLSTAELDSGQAATETPSLREPDLPIYISGAVKHPGVYYLAPGSLLVDLVEQAGGFTESEPPPDLNLAASLQAHAHVHVAGAEELAAGAGSQVTYHAELDASTIGVGEGAAGGQSGLISLNHASQEELETIPGIGPKTAQAILRLRADLGRDLVLEDLLTIPGIKEKRYDQIKSFFCLP